MLIKLTLSEVAIRGTFADLADLARTTAETPYACGTVCTIAANLIQSAGAYGGMAQTNMMKLAEAAGFTPEFYAGGIRVSFLPKESTMELLYGSNRYKVKRNQERIEVEEKGTIRARMTGQDAADFVDQLTHCADGAEEHLCEVAIANPRWKL